MYRWVNACDIVRMTSNNWVPVLPLIIKNAGGIKVILMQVKNTLDVNEKELINSLNNKEKK